MYTMCTMYVTNN